jgi:uncharacterized Ntn-hydrolase superfamily protein
MRHSNRPVQTYSIVARHPASGDLGVAVQSHWFTVGSVVTWAEAGVGAVATQSFADAGYGTRALDLIRNGLSARKALASLLAVDGHREQRQVAVIDCRGRVAAHTGKECIDVAGHHTGKGYSVQANMVRPAAVLPPMVEAFKASRGDLAQRLLTALQAGERAAGDIRGRRSAAIVVVRERSRGSVARDRLVDMRVEDHPDPIGELQRLLVVHRAYAHLARGDDALERGEIDRALSEYRAAADMAPDNPEMIYWHAVALSVGGRMDEALPLFRQVFATEPRWIELTRQLHKSRLIPNTEDGHALVDRIIDAAGVETVS